MIDFIGHQLESTIDETKDYHRFLGGSPTNVAMNLARLGMSPSLVATTGHDGFAKYIYSRLNEVGVKTDNMRSIDKPTSVIFVSRTTSTPDFIPFRSADIEIVDDQIPEDLLRRTKIFHTTCFALSRQPSRSTILDKARLAANLGCELSIDLNFADKLWQDRSVAIEVIKTYCSYNSLIKISEDDMLRLFGNKLPHHEIFEFFHDLGSDKVCLTLGSEGVKFSDRGRPIISLPAIKIEEIQDATGAGDAFWSGFLYAYLNGGENEKCLEVALKLAAFKLQNVGRLPNHINVLSSLL